MVFKGIYQWLNLSHNYGVSLKLRDIYYLTAEHMYYSLMSECEIEKVKIAGMELESLREYKIEHPDDDFDKLAAMERVLDYKFNISRFFFLLLTIKEDDIVYESDDLFWGSKDDVGQNQLGKLLSKKKKEITELYNVVTKDFRVMPELNIREYNKIIYITNFKGLYQLKRKLSRTKESVLVCLSGLENRNLKLTKTYRTLKRFNRNKNITIVRSSRIYTGIGSRKLPYQIEALISRISIYLNSFNYELRSGDAIGSDKAFDRFSTNKDIYLAGQKNDTGYNYRKVTFTAKSIARAHHPAWDYIKNEYILNLFGRNTYQVLSYSLSHPTDFVISYTPDGIKTEKDRSNKTGGTGLAISLADKLNIKIYNLGNPEDFDYWDKKTNYIKETGYIM